VPAGSLHPPSLRLLSEEAAGAAARGREIPSPVPWSRIARLLWHLSLTWSSQMAILRRQRQTLALVCGASQLIPGPPVMTEGEVQRHACMTKTHWSLVGMDPMLWSRLEWRGSQPSSVADVFNSVHEAPSQPCVTAPLASAVSATAANSTRQRTSKRYGAQPTCVLCSQYMHPLKRSLIVEVRRAPCFLDKQSRRRPHPSAEHAPSTTDQNQFDPEIAYGSRQPQLWRLSRDPAL